MLVGDLVIWFYEYLAGIAPDDANPGFKHIVMRPHPVGDLDWVKASFRSPYGLVRSEWQEGRRTSSTGKSPCRRTPRPPSTSPPRTPPPSPKAASLRKTPKA